MNSSPAFGTADFGFDACFGFTSDIEASRTFINPEAGTSHKRVVVLGNVGDTRGATYEALKIYGELVARCHAILIARDQVLGERDRVGLFSN